MSIHYQLWIVFKVDAYAIPKSKQDIVHRHGNYKLVISALFPKSWKLISGFKKHFTETSQRHFNNGFQRLVELEGMKV